MRPLMICLHASKSNVEVIDRALHEIPFDIQHEVDTHLLSLIRTQQPIEVQKDYVLNKLDELFSFEPAFIFVTCTNFIVLLDKLKYNSPVPILKIDDILFEQMKDISTPIKILFTNEQTIPGTMQRLRQFFSNELEIEVVHIPEAFEWYLAGDKLGHDQKVLDILLELGTYETTLVVAQLSMANIASIYSKLSGIQVLSPITAFQAYIDKLKNGTA